MYKNAATTARTRTKHVTKRLPLYLQRIFNGGILRHQLGRKILVGNFLVLHGELIALRTEAANPQFGLEVNLRKQDKIISTKQRKRQTGTGMTNAATVTEVS